jgi:hypothetical protein
MYDIELKKHMKRFSVKIILLLLLRHKVSELLKI